MRLLGINDHEGLWSEKGGVLEKQSNVGLLGKSYKILLTLFNKDIEMFLINKSLMK